MINKVKAKKHLGQHFLNDENIAQKIVNTLSYQTYDKLLEIGPGMGMLTKYLLQKPIDTYLIEIDTEAVVYLNERFPELSNKIITKDFLKFDLSEVFKKQPFAIIGNFPYNISSQIVFKILECRDQVVEFSGMFQREVAQRICEKKGSKTYGILSVLVQAFYDTEYLFTVSENVFTPVPKVKSGVLRLTRKENYRISCNEKLFFSVVKNAFNQRRKTLRNSLKVLIASNTEKTKNIFNLRPEQLSVGDFVEITNIIENTSINQQI